MPVPYTHLNVVPTRRTIVVVILNRRVRRVRGMKYVFKNLRLLLPIAKKPPLRSQRALRLIPINSS